MDLAPFARSLLEAELVRAGFDVAESRDFARQTFAQPMEVNDPDRRTPGQRRAANIEALRLLQAEDCCGRDDRRILRRYTGWGGLSTTDLPANLGAVRREELLATYYTPTRLCWDLAALLRPRVVALEKFRGRVLRCLEPSAGVGRFIQPWGPEIARGLQEWTAFEPDPMSATVLHKLFPDVEVVRDVFEISSWHPAYDLVLSNPPYGVRDVREQDPRGREIASAQDYFLAKTLSTLRPMGLAVYLVPSGFLTGSRARERREAAMRAARFLGAVRLPNALFPGANLMTDLLVFRRRAVDGLDDDDQAILDGQWFSMHPELILGTIGKGKFGDAIKGNYQGLPEFMAFRADLELEDAPVLALSDAAADVDVITDAVKARLRRIESRLTLVVQSGVYDGLQEIVDDADALIESVPSGAVRARVEQALAQVRLTAAAARPTTEEQPWLRPDNLAEQARHLRQAAITLDMRDRSREAAAFEIAKGRRSAEVAALNNRVGGVVVDAEAVEHQLVEQGWGLEWREGAAHPDLVPPEEFWLGDPWRHVDRLARVDDPRAVALRRRVLERIGPVAFDAVPVPQARAPWVPLPILSRWIQHVLGTPVPIPLVRSHELRSLAPAGDSLVGWLNGDVAEWGVKAEQQIEVDLRLANNFARWWPSMEAELQELATEAYNRAFRGVEHTPEDLLRPLKLARLGINLKPHQVTAVNRLGPRGLMALDVGLGKTFTALALLARARQGEQGAGQRARRAVIVVPASVLGNWLKECQRALPDMTFAVVGYRTTRTGSQALDTPEERVEKWRQLASGEVDFVLTTETSLMRLRMPVPEEVREHPFVQGAALARANGRRRTERQTVLSAAVMAAFFKDLNEPVHEPDPISWAEVGIDLLIVDEAHHTRKALAPDEFLGAVPDYAGNTATSRTAFQLWMRCIVTKFVYLLTATPVVNGPVELAVLMTAIDKNLFTRMGVFSVSQWMATFLDIQLKERETMTGSVIRPAVVGLRDLAALRQIMSPLSVWMTARETLGTASDENPGGLPETTAETFIVEPDEPTEMATQEIIEDLEEAVRKGAVSLVMGLLMALRKAAIHPQLYLQGERRELTVKTLKGPVAIKKRMVPEAYTEPPDELLSTAKLEKLASVVKANRGCGHLVFTESVAAHAWIAKFLRARGLVVLVLNAEVALSPEKRQKIADEFNSGGVQVLLGNQVMAEGINVQREGCRVHNLDTPWSPSQLHQRAGRVVRQFSSFREVFLYYYVVRGGADLFFLQAVLGKAGWLQTLIGAGDDTTNPAATAELDPLQLLASASRQPEFWRGAYEEKRARQRFDEREKRARENVARARRFLTLWQSCGPDAAECREEAAKILPTIDDKVVSQQRLRAVADEPGARVVSDGGIFYDGVWVERETGDEVELVQVGKDDGYSVVLRSPGRLTWERFDRSVLLEREDRSVRVIQAVPEGPTAPVEENVLFDAGKNTRAGDREALNWNSAPEAWLRLNWDDSLVLRAAKTSVIPYLAFRGPDGALSVAPTRAAPLGHTLVRIYEHAEWRRSALILHEAAPTIARRYFGQELPDPEILLEPVIEGVLFASDVVSASGSPVPSALSVYLEARRPDGERHKTIHQRRAIAEDTRKIIRRIPTGAPELGPSPLAGTQLTPQGLELLGSGEVRPVSRKGLAMVLAEAQFGATVAAWRVPVHEGFTPNGLPFRVVEHKDGLLVLLLRVPRPALEDRGAVLGWAPAQSVDEARRAAARVAEDVPAAELPTRARLSVTPMLMSGALAALDNLAAQRDRPVLAWVGPQGLRLGRVAFAGTQDRRSTMSLWVRVAEARFDGDGASVATISIENFSALVAEARAEYLLTAETWSSGRLTVAVERTAAAPDDVPAMSVAGRWEDLRGAWSSRFTVYVDAQGLVVDAATVVSYHRGHLAVPSGVAYSATGEQVDSFPQLFGPMAVGFAAKDGGVTLVFADGRFDAVFDGTATRSRVWPDVVDPVVVNASKVAKALATAGDKPVVLAMRGAELAVVVGDDTLTLKVASGAAQWSLGVRNPKIVRRVFAQEGETEVRLAVWDGKLWVANDEVEYVLY